MRNAYGPSVLAGKDSLPYDPKPMEKTDTLSEEYILRHCPHCDPASDAFTSLLLETEHFRVVCDHHPLTEGHLLIVPKTHISCIGAFPSPLFGEFTKMYAQAAAFIRDQYGDVSAFEHGNIGQTVFHSHIHLLSFRGEPAAIVPEGLRHCVPLLSLEDLTGIFGRGGQYLFFALGDRMWTVDTALAAPRFFRDRFAAALGNTERGNWKTMHEDAGLMTAGAKENARAMAKWKKAMRA